MINIISKSYCSRFTSGPKKVVDNLIKGLEKIGYPYVVNKRLDACQRLWIHDDVEALRQINKLPKEIKIVLGPNLVNMPRHLPKGLDISRTVYVLPSNWAISLWKEFGFDNFCPMESWPVGIDTEEFVPSSDRKDIVLVYFKQRSLFELRAVEKALQEKNIGYKTLIYPLYYESEYKSLLSRAKYVIWLGRQESQGIALQEALSANIPVLIWDVSSLGHWVASGKEMSVYTDKENKFSEATSAYYFNATCGVQIKELSQLDEALGKMEKECSGFSPRKFILENLSLSKQAQDFLSIYEKHFQQSSTQGKQEKISVNGDWVNNSLKMRVRIFIKDILKIGFNFYRRMRLDFLKQLPFIDY